MGKKLAHFAVKLRGQRLVVGENQRGTLQRGNHVRHGERLARTGDAKERLAEQPGADTVGQRSDGFRLVARGFKVRDELE